MAKQRFKLYKEIKITGKSDAEAVRESIEQFNREAKKRAKFTATELRRVLISLPINFLQVLEEEKDQLTRFIESEITKRRQQLSALGTIDTASSGGQKSGIESSIRSLEKRREAFQTQQATNWTTLENLRKDFNVSGQHFQLGHRDISVSLLRLQILENNWPGLTEYQKDSLDKAQLALAKIDKLDSVELRELGYGHQKSPTLKEIPDLLELASQDLSLSVKLAKETYVSLTEGRGRIAIDLEPATINKYKGNLSKLVSQIINDIIENKFKTTSLLDQFDIQHIESSPGFLEDIETQLTTAILGKKSRPIRRKKVSKTEQKAARSTKLAAARSRVKGKKIPKLPRIKDIKVGAELPLFSIMALINEALASQIKDNMGDPNDPPLLLRNQTGRFAESARMLTLRSSNRGVLFGTYSYQRHPYDVFLPGGKLHAAKRDPRLYIEGSIRELAIVIMKRKFPGLALELV